MVALVFNSFRDQFRSERPHDVEFFPFLNSGDEDWVVHAEFIQVACFDERDFRAALESTRVEALFAYNDLGLLVFVCDDRLFGVT